MREVSLEFENEYDQIVLIVFFDGLNFITTIEKPIDLGYRNDILSASRHDKLVRAVQAIRIDQYFEEILGVIICLQLQEVEWQVDGKSDGNHLNKYIE